MLYLVRYNSVTRMSISILELRTTFLSLTFLEDGAGGQRQDGLGSSHFVNQDVEELMSIIVKHYQKDCSLQV